MSFSHKNLEVTLLGTAFVTPELTVLEACTLLTTENLPIPPEVQHILDQFKHVF